MTEHKTIEEMRILEQDYILQITNENRALCNVWKELFESEEEKSNTAASNNEMYKERIANADREKEELVKKYEQMLQDIELSKCKVIEEIESNKIIIDKQNSENKRLNDEIIKLTETLKLSDENKRKNDKLKNEGKDSKAKDKHIKQLEIKYAKLEKESKDVTAELEAMTKEHKILQAQIKEEKAMQEEMSQQLTQKQKDLLKSVKEKEGKLKQQETEHKAEVKNLIAEYEKSLDAANKQIALLTKEQNNVPHKTKDSEIETRKLRREYEEKILKNEKEYKNKIKEKDLKIDELEYELYIKKEIATTIEENEAEIENLRKEIKEYKKKNYDATKLNDKYKKEIANLQKNNDKIGSSKLDHEVEKLRDENEALRAKLNEIEAEMNKKLEALEVENERLQKENKKTVKNDAGKYENEIRKHEKQVKALEAMLEKKEHEIAGLRDKILKNSRNMSSQEVRNNKGYEDKITEMEAKINEFQDKIYELENKSVASMLERDASNIVSQQKICGLKAKKSRTISGKVDKEESHTDETFADVSRIVENSQQIGVADHTLRNAKRRNESEIDASSLSVKGKRKPRTRVTYQRKPQKRAKKENLAAPVIKAPISKTKNLNIDKKEPIENFLSDNNFTPLTQKIGGLFDDLTFTEDSSIFGKNQK